ncbi:unnamed protein product [Linum tenue]|uniref:Peptide N-acetyl-beta-D-glucosaminyl asparaginase amidase A N-terminal domain-containing protein n=1 Tax=Linum tenue TaxID=586396 RepID=A0AAV0KKN3_9ROSI|nr:unnamed protein product [Linum tenue]
MSCFSFFSLLPLLLLQTSIATVAHQDDLPNLHSHRSPSRRSSKPNTVFQVTKPIDVPNTVPCKQLLLEHDFGSTMGKPPVVVDYNGPPSHCASYNFSKIVLEWTGTCNGTQGHTIFGVWLDGVELIRSSPAQTPGLNVSVAWTARKDITRYSSLLLKKETQKLAVFLRNMVYSVFTGVYHITIGVSFYPSPNPKIITDNSGFEFVSNNIADLILPISRNVESKDGLWFPIENSTDEKQIKEFKIPQNAYRAVLEVYVSPIDTDETWWSSYPAGFYSFNHKLLGGHGDGPFRDVMIRLDDVVVGAIWPYPVIFGAGNDMWNPVASIGCFDLPSYDIELTPFLGTLLNGGIHNLSFGIGNAVSVWYIDANLHIWLDHQSSKTTGELVSSNTEPLHLSSTLAMKGLVMESRVEAQRMISSQGWVQSSHGKITSHVTQMLHFTNNMYMAFDSVWNYSSRVEQFTLLNDSISFVKNSSTVPNFLSFDSVKKFALSNKDEMVPSSTEGDGNDVQRTDIETGYDDEKTCNNLESGSVMTTTLKDQQIGNGVWIVKNFSWLDEVLDMKQLYNYKNVGDNSKVCYLRSIATTNATIVYDKEDVKC